ncbi:Integrase [Hahella chejuensis KCTC 2396]|uniref:Integrase n=1 Tax=Hahella chejuensis (strain KCTC 2396) TaxID=349521 RepID=Q2SI95_HAHCH|nr:site-specific integrase [Hahella chejuensis]ABC29629.1 Integrase [Hahella chejuensis KCTC 2396]
MASSRKRVTKSGEVRWYREIRIKRDGKIIYREGKTWPSKRLADEWGKRRELELAQPGALERMRHSGTTLSDVLSWYYDEYKDIARFGRSKSYRLRAMMQMEELRVPILSLNSSHLVEFVRARRRHAGPSTVRSDLAYLKNAVKLARGHFEDFPVDMRVFDDAGAVCWKNKLIAMSARRDRRPTDDELRMLTDYFRNRAMKPKMVIPMYDIIWFAIHSARRLSEILEIRWADNDSETLTGLARDVKHPTKKHGNHRKFKYTREAWDIVSRQERNPDDDRIFPYKANAVSRRFCLACRELGINDLRFHDLRHEATSRLFERGYDIVQVQQFTLHESWRELQRYTNLRPADVPLLPAAPHHLDFSNG